MQTFLQKEYISEEKNTHMTHIEDQVLYGGVDGTRQAINGLRELRDMLGGQHKGSVSVKWDGAPAIFAGTDPSDGKFFVAKKGIFNKNPKVYKTKADVDADTSGDLNDKLNVALKLLPSLGIKGVIQGDFLFGPGDISRARIAGESYITFHPNTIVYAIPAESEEAKRVRQATIGVVWHTTYSGSSFDTMKASYGVKVSALRKNSKVWSQDAMLRDLTNTTMSSAETKSVNAHLANAGKIFRQISGSTLRELGANKELGRLIEQYNNTFVRAGEQLPDSRKHAVRLQRWIETRFKKEIDKRKSDAGKKKQKDAMDGMLSFFSKENLPSIVKMFDLQKEIVSAKLILIRKLDTLTNVNTFVKSKRGYQTTGEEGYVAIDKLGGNALKIVDRMEFSYNNFSPNILKGWDTPSRN